MAWNWQHWDWPQFIWNERALLRAETLFVEGAGVTIGAAKHISETERADLLVDLMSHEAADTSAIEGESLDRDSIQSSIRKQLGLSAVARRAKPAEAGIAKLMVDLYREMGTPLTESTLHHWHRLIVNGRTDLADIGRYRRGEEPMQIVSGPYGRQKVHFEAPPAGRLKTDMKRFWHWLDQSALGGTTSLPPLTRAGIAHIWFESIHPNEDGNGRIYRPGDQRKAARPGAAHACIHWNGDDAAPASQGILHGARTRACRA